MEMAQRLATGLQASGRLAGCCCIVVLMVGCGDAGAPATAPIEGAFLTRGPAAETFACGKLATDCDGSTRRFVEARCGVVVAEDGQRVQVPVVPAEGPDPTALYDSCNGTGDNPDHLAELQTVVIDPEGEEVTGYLFADNYFELYVNGTIVARDPIGFVPFNSAVVRFKAAPPFTIAVKLVDWGTHVGVGMEYDEWRVGDGGFIARFDDGTETNATWKCKAHYISPLQDAGCVRPGPDSSACPERPACARRDPASCQAMHVPVPENWATPQFDDSQWPAATTYRASAVTRNDAYRDYAEKFGSAEFIWSHNLNQDNLVLCRAGAGAE